MQLPPGNSGFWGPVTSLLDWCELNYTESYYIAEFWNTLSNAPIIAFSLMCWIQCWRNGLEMRYHLASLSFLLVGIGSAAFHATLLFKNQLLDELPMVCISTI